MTGLKYLKRSHLPKKLTAIVIFQVVLKAIFIVSYVGNRGTFDHNVRRLLSDRNLVLHLMYFTFGFLGLTLHTFFYSILVSVVIKYHFLVIFCDDFT